MKKRLIPERIIDSYSGEIGSRLLAGYEWARLRASFHQFATTGSDRVPVRGVSNDCASFSNVYDVANYASRGQQRENAKRLRGVDNKSDERKPTTT